MMHRSSTQEISKGKLFSAFLISITFFLDATEETIDMRIKQMDSTKAYAHGQFHRVTGEA
jgi:hypothetical protein